MDNKQHYLKISTICLQLSSLFKERKLHHNDHTSLTTDFSAVLIHYLVVLSGFQIIHLEDSYTIGQLCRFLIKQITNAQVVEMVVGLLFAGAKSALFTSTFNFQRGEAGIISSQKKSMGGRKRIVKRELEKGF